MKRYIKILALLCFLAAATPALAELQFQRATLTVSDMERSLHFYENLLRFTLTGPERHDTPALRIMFHIPEGTVPRLVLLDASPDQPRALALVHAEGLSVDATANARHAPALVFNTTELDDIMGRLEAADALVILPPTPLNDFSGKPFGREAMVLDPDGVRLVLFQLLSATDD